MKHITFISILFFLSSCAMVPKFSENQTIPSCDLVTKKMELDLIVIDDDMCSGEEADVTIACLVTAGFIMGATTIISGSIVLAGNTVHWLEKQGTCDDKLLKTHVLKHNKPLLENNGKAIDLKKTENN